MLDDNAVVAVHDTGYWSKAFLDKRKVTRALWRPGKVLVSGNATPPNEYYLHPNSAGERAFIEWIDEAYPATF